MDRLRFASLRCWWARLCGWWNLRYGLCPFCGSSPPLPECPVCEGSHRYGPHATREERDE